jgi:hypothetical protein
MVQEPYNSCFFRGHQVSVTFSLALNRRGEKIWRWSVAQKAGLPDSPNKQVETWNSLAREITGPQIFPSLCVVSLCGTLPGPRSTTTARAERDSEASRRSDLHPIRPRRGRRRSATWRPRCRAVSRSPRRAVSPIATRWQVLRLPRS